MSFPADVCVCQPEVSPASLEADAPGNLDVAIAVRIDERVRSGIVPPGFRTQCNGERAAPIPPQRESIELEALEPAAGDRRDLEPDVGSGGVRMCVEPRCRSAPDTASLLAVDRTDRATVAVPRALLDLDEDEPGASPDDQVELVTAGPDVGPEDPVTAEAVVPRGDPLTAVHRGR